MNREEITQHHCDPNSPKFDCVECDKKFTVLQHLNRHLLLIHGVRLFVWCPSCRSYFARIDALKKHQSRCHQTDSISSSLLGGTASNNNRNESVRSIANLSAIGTSTVGSSSKSRNLMGNSSDRVMNSVISSQQSGGQMIGTSSLRRDENHYMSQQQANKQTSIINLNSNALNNSNVNQSTSTGNNQNNIDENLFQRTQNALPTVFANNLALVRNSVISRGGTASNMMMNMEEQLQNTLNDNANRIKLLNGNIMLGNSNKVQYMSTGVSNEREAVNNNNLHNPFDTVRDDYLYRNKKIRFGELMDKDRVFKQ